MGGFYMQYLESKSTCYSIFVTWSSPIAIVAPPRKNHSVMMMMRVWGCNGGSSSYMCQPLHHEDVQPTIRDPAV